MEWYEMTPLRGNHNKEKLYLLMEDLGDLAKAYNKVPEEYRKVFNEISKLSSVYGGFKRFERKIERHLKETDSKLKLEEIKKRGWIYF